MGRRPDLQRPFRRAMTLKESCIEMFWERISRVKKNVLLQTYLWGKSRNF